MSQSRVQEKMRVIEAKQEDEISRAVEEMERETGPGESSISKSKTDNPDIKVHTTKPIDKSLEKIKKRRKPRKKKEIGEENIKNDNPKKSGGNGGRETPRNADNGKRSPGGRFGFDWPIDW